VFGYVQKSCEIWLPWDRYMCSVQHLVVFDVESMMKYFSLQTLYSVWNNLPFLVI
jgi:hypothetical protein